MADDEQTRATHEAPQGAGAEPAAAGGNAPKALPTAALEAPNDASNGAELGALAVLDEPHERPLARAEVRPTPVDVYLARFDTEKGRESAQDALKRVLRLLGTDDGRWRTFRWWRLRPAHTALVRAKLVAGFKPATSRHALSILRGCLKACMQTGWMTADAFHRTTGWAPVRGRSAPPGRMLMQEEIDTLRTYCEKKLDAFAGAMVWAMFACGLGAGLRRDELARLGVEALSDDARHLFVIGKGKKEVIQPIPPWTGAALEAWLAQRARFDFKTETMFVRLGMDHKAHDKPLTTKRVWWLIHQVSLKAGCKPFTPHDLRRTYASVLIEKEGLDVASGLMRHESVETTMRYDRRPAKRGELAMRSLEGMVKEESKEKP